MTKFRALEPFEWVRPDGCPGYQALRRAIEDEIPETHQDGPSEEETNLRPNSAIDGGIQSVLRQPIFSLKDYYFKSRHVYLCWFILFLSPYESMLQVGLRQRC